MAQVELKLLQTSSLINLRTEGVRVVTEAKTRSLIINHIQIILKVYYKTVKDSFLNIPTAVPTTTVLCPSSTTMRTGQTTSRVLSKGSRITLISMMRTQVTFFRSKWILPDLEGLGLLMGPHQALKTIRATTNGKVLVLTTWARTIITDLRALNPTKVLGSMWRIDEPDQKLWKLLKIMETCSLFNRQTVWKIVHKLVKGKTCFQKWSLTM